MTQKDEMRRRVLAIRRAIIGDELAAASDAIWARLQRLEEWSSARTIHTYIGALGGEVRTSRPIEWCLGNDRTVLVPLVDVRRHEMSAVRLSNMDCLRETDYGTMEPSSGEAADVAGEAVTLATVDLIIVPGVAFDRRGNRLGMGGGYYDRLLRYDQMLQSCVAPSVALAHSCQIVDAVPVDESDEPVDIIVTPDEVIRVDDVAT
jgi:5-formyltetrahydrofolate cyclo-ligase